MHDLVESAATAGGVLSAVSDLDRYLEAATRQNTQRSYASAQRHLNSNEVAIELQPRPRIAENVHRLSWWADLWH